MKAGLLIYFHICTCDCIFAIFIAEIPIFSLYDFHNFHDHAACFLREQHLTPPYNMRDSREATHKDFKDDVNLEALVNNFIK